jgi:L-ribulose-5-phosphate 3-epimerase UlaE
MHDELYKLIHNVPFRAFTVCLTDQRRFPVPSRDHIFLSKGGTVIIQDDLGVIDIISVRQISSIQIMDELTAA